MDIDSILDEITKLEQLKASVQKAKAHRIEQKGKTERAKQNFKHRKDLQKDRIQHAEKRVKYTETELKIASKERMKKQREKEHPTNKSSI